MKDSLRQAVTTIKYRPGSNAVVGLSLYGLQLLEARAAKHVSALTRPKYQTAVRLTTHAGVILALTKIGERHKREVLGHCAIIHANNRRADEVNASIHLTRELTRQSKILEDCVASFMGVESPSSQSGAAMTPTKVAV